MHIFHKWEYFDRTRADVFLGEPITQYSRRFRRCRKCRRVQEFQYDFQSGDWSTLNAQETEIFNREADRGAIDGSKL